MLIVMYNLYITICSNFWIEAQEATRRWMFPKIVDLSSFCYCTDEPAVQIWAGFAVLGVRDARSVFEWEINTRSKLNQKIEILCCVCAVLVFYPGLLVCFTSSIV
jgi:hypothetical protein